MDYLRILVWTLATKLQNLDPNLWRLDPVGRLIHWDAFGDRHNPLGWEVGHVIARVDGGSDFLPNRQAENYKTNLEKEAARKRSQSIGIELGGFPQSYSLGAFASAAQGQYHFSLADLAMQFQTKCKFTGI